MKIFFDHQTFSLQNYGGISRYYTELVTGINNRSDAEAYLPLLFSNNAYLHELGLDVKPFFKNSNIYKKIQSIYYINKVYTISRLKFEPYDIFHATYYDPYFLPYIKNKPFVVTFLDMIHEKFGGQFPDLADDKKITSQKSELANRASRIIAISESTKKDIVEIFDIDSSKIDVIYLGSSLKPKAQNYTERLIKEPYFLFVGNRSNYKNFVGLVNGISRILKQYKIKLVCAGGGDFTNDEKEIFTLLKLSTLIEQRPLNDHILTLLYQQAIAFIFPSLYEGFGIPILEAFSCCCPCVVSNNSSLPEVAGDAALYIDPLTPESIADVAEQLLLDESLRNSLIQKGIQRLALFSWERTINQTIGIYKGLS